MKNSVLTIMKKELARFFKDKRMLITTVFLPGILIYVIYSFMGDALMSNFAGEDDYKPQASVVNMPESIKPLFTAADIVVDEIEQADTDAAKQKVKNGEADLCIVFPTDFENSILQYNPATGEAAPNISLYFNSNEANSENAFYVVSELLDGYESALANKFDVNNSEEKYDLADEKDLTAMIFSSMLPMLLMMFMFSGCMAVAPESIAGEKERGTIATLLITPVKRGNIALGKIFALSVIAVLSGTSSTVGTVLSLPKLMGGAEEGIVSNVYNAGDYALLALIIISTVLLLVTAVSIISAFAKTIKEAQSYVSPFMILTMIIGVSGMFGNGIKTDLAVYLIPLYNSVQCMIGIFSFDIVPSYIAVTVISNIIYAGLGVFALSKMFNSEKIIFTK